MTPCLHNWLANIFIDISTVNECNSTFVMTLAEQHKGEDFVFDEKILYKTTKEMEVA